MYAQNTVMVTPDTMYRHPEHVIASFRNSGADEMNRHGSYTMAVFQVPTHSLDFGAARKKGRFFTDELPYLVDTELFTHCAVNANSGEETWYGFGTWDELHFFLKLLTLDKVGPKTAFKVMDKTPFTRIQALIQAGDQVGFRKLPGMGGKIADQLVPLLFTGKPQKAAPDVNEDAVATLKALGMKAGPAREVVAKTMEANPDADTETLVKLCLKKQ